MVASSAPGAAVGQASAYRLDKTNGATMLTIAVGHSIDTLALVLGEFCELSALSDIRRPLMTVLETGEQVTKRLPTRSPSSGASPPVPPPVRIFVRAR